MAWRSRDVFDRQSTNGSSRTFKVPVIVVGMPGARSRDEAAGRGAEHLQRAWRVCLWDDLAMGYEARSTNNSGSDA